MLGYNIIAAITIITFPFCYPEFVQKHQMNLLILGFLAVFLIFTVVPIIFDKINRMEIEANTVIFHYNCNKLILSLIYSLAQFLMMLFMYTLKSENEIQQSFAFAIFCTFLSLIIWIAYDVVGSLFKIFTM